MKILIVNPIIYTSDTRKIKKVNTIRDTMIYDLCLGFIKRGAEVTLAAAEDYRPTENEDYPFEVLWLKTRLKKICPPNALPYCPEIKSIAKKGNYDLIITSEVFSLNSLMLAIHCNKNLIVWHELAKHNKIFKGIASRLWYNIVARIFFKNKLIVARSTEAKQFISNFCNNVCDEIIDHGVNLDKFTANEKKDNIFVVSSQLIGRKRIDKIIDNFVKYTKKYNNNSKLIIMGEGESRVELENQVKVLNAEDSITFTGKLNHSELINYLSRAQAMLVYTEKDNNMVSIVESIAVGTPVITTSVPYNASYIKANELGIVSDSWNEDSLKEIVDNNNNYIANCLSYRSTLATTAKADMFIKINSSKA